MSLAFGYGTNGLADHRVDEALGLVAELGYDGVALTLDHQHLDPFADDVVARTAFVRDRIEREGLRVVVETGARYVLDPRRKHHPTLVSDAGRDRRVDLLIRAVRIAADLDAEVVSFWSGTLPEGTDPAEGWQRLVEGVALVLEEARLRGVRCAFEPEPGMFVDTVDGVAELRSRLGDPAELHYTLDIGHTVCNETRTAAQCVHDLGRLLANVQVDDMLPGTHEHLELGEGDLDLAGTLQALIDVGYPGLASVELPRHSHAGPAVAERAIRTLRATTDQLTGDAASPVAPRTGTAGTQPITGTPAGPAVTEVSP